MGRRKRGRGEEKAFFAEQIWRTGVFAVRSQLEKTKPAEGDSEAKRTDPRRGAGRAVKREKLGEDRAKAGVIFGVY